jgi:hypothetical protein
MGTAPSRRVQPDPLALPGRSGGGKVTMRKLVKATVMMPDGVMSNTVLSMPPHASSEKWGSR